MRFLLEALNTVSQTGATSDCGQKRASSASSASHNSSAARLTSAPWAMFPVQPIHGAAQHHQTASDGMGG
jgi:hypothetical protein